MREVHFSELDELIRHFDEGYQTSHDEAYRRFSQVSLSPPDDLPSDPFSPEYREFFLNLYRKISDEPVYSVQNEKGDARY